MLNTTDTTRPGADQQQSHGTIARRTLALGGMATAIAGLMDVMPIDPAAAANANEDISDLVLIQLSACIVAIRRDRSALQARMYDLLPVDPVHDTTFNAILTLDDEADRLAGQVAKMPARTQLGIQARAAAVHAMQPMDFGIDDLVPIDWHRGMLDALLRDVMGRA